MTRMLTLGVLLLGHALAVESLRVGDHLLLTDTALVGDRFLVPAFLTDAQGKRVPRAPWLGRPLTVTAETSSAYVLRGEAGQVWLPRRNLGAKAVFPLTRDAETVALAARLSGKNVWPFARPEEATGPGGTGSGLRSRLSGPRESDHGPGPQPLHHPSCDLRKRRRRGPQPLADPASCATASRS